ncbi:hypothetical protein HMPREF0520_0268 [Lactobacillus iners DSM 13335]|uniref:Uncharacterized protein n=1 Tax=Lactobacillus iners DSM 13335 TaxID=525328 RepID=C8PAZ8_9LACO|nr:hypothetical protein HMPREF0520_0268 [Lactobacillus iners DSM 13335]EFU78492.1 hypothetical protein HMPREF9223_1107 [Lactobacillus iners ATCC 55195]
MVYNYQMSLDIIIFMFIMKVLQNFIEEIHLKILKQTIKMM